MNHDKKFAAYQVGDEKPVVIPYDKEPIEQHQEGCIYHSEGVCSSPYQKCNCPKSTQEKPIDELDVDEGQLIIKDKPIGWEEEFDKKYVREYLPLTGMPYIKEFRGAEVETLKSFISRLEASAYQKGKDDAVGYIEKEVNKAGGLGGLNHLYSILEAAANQKMV